MNRSTHILQRLILDLQARTPSVARDAQHRWQGLWESMLAPAVGQVCDELVPADDLIVLDRLDVDLGYVEEGMSEGEILVLLGGSLRRELAEALASSRRFGRESSWGSAGTMSTERRVLHFLRTGVLPWWSDTPAADILAGELRDLLEDDDETAARWVARHGDDVRIVRRAFQQFGPRRAAQLVAVLITVAHTRAATPSEFITRRDDLVRLEGLPMEEMEAVWKYFIDRTLSLPEKTSRLAAILEGRRTSSSPPSSSHTTRPADSTVMASGRETIPAGEQHEVPVRHAAAESPSEKSEDRRQPVGAEPRDPELSVPPIPMRPRDRKVGGADLRDGGGDAQCIEESASQPGDREPATPGAVPLRLDFTAGIKDASRHPLFDSAPVSEGEDASETSSIERDERTARASIDDPRPIHARESSPARPRLADVLEPTQPTDAIRAWDRSNAGDGGPPLEEIAIENAGLVILWPYVPRFFERVGLRRGDGWMSEESAVRGVHLLQFLAVGEGDRPEYEMVLNKILCGLPLEDPVPFNLALSPREREEGEALLEQVIAHWAALKRTSVRGFQLGFLARRGQIEAGDAKWIVRVERETRDVLLDRLPWGLARFRFSWMDRSMEVRW